MTFPIFLPERTTYSRNDQFLLNFPLLQNSFRICLFDHGFQNMVHNSGPKDTAKPRLNIGLLLSSRRIHTLFLQSGTERQGYHRITEW